MHCTLLTNTQTTDAQQTQNMTSPPFQHTKSNTGSIEQTLNGSYILTYNASPINHFSFSFHLSVQVTEKREKSYVESRH